MCSMANESRNRPDPSAASSQTAMLLDDRGRCAVVFCRANRYQNDVPGPPLNGPVTLAVIQPP